MKQLLWHIIYLTINVLFTINSFAQLPEGFARIQIAEKLDPTAMTMAPDGRIFIAEKNGIVRIVREGQLLPDPFLTIPVDNFNERGLGGIVLDPNFEYNHLVYVFYTVPDSNYNRVSRFTANGDYAIPSSEEIVLNLDPLSGTIHNGGAMAFGPDGKLYLSIGDGANRSNAQNLNSLSGKILRINSDGSIPEDNPFYNQTTDQYRAIWALGLRNSFTFAFQPGTGRLFANDVGDGNFEEVNEIVKGGNYGWDRIEGPRAAQIPPDNYKEPFYHYPHSEGCCIIGAAFYNPNIVTFPNEYAGRFFFADYCDGYMKVLNPETAQVEGTFIEDLNQLVQILVSPEGDLYYLSRAGIGGGSIADNTSTNNGSLWRVFYEGSGAPFISVQPQSVTVPIGENAIFRVQASGKVPLIYEWQVNDVTVATQDSAVFIFKNVSLADHNKKIKCFVKNAQGEVSSTEAILNVTTNKRPGVNIIQPASGSTYRAGTVIHFSGSGIDAEDGALNADNLTWKIDFHHDNHIHPALDATEGIESGTFKVPQIGEVDDNVFYRIYLTATDREGLTQTTYRDIFPVKTQFIVNTQPTGFQINVDGKTVAAPYTATSVEGIRRGISAPLSQIINGKLYFFKEWQNGDTQDFYTFLAGENSSITAHYELANLAIGNGTGLHGNYYPFPPTMRPDSAFTLQSKLSRVDSVINFNWVFAAPHPTIPADYYAVRWTGKMMPPLTGIYTFYVISDDGVRLWIDNKLLVDEWIPRPETADIFTMQLEAGKLYSIKMDYFEAGGHAVAKLLWSTDRLPRQAVPTTQLFPERQPKIPVGKDFDIRLSPNPATSILNLEIDSKYADQIDWQVFDNQGKMMLRGKETVAIGANIFELSLANLAAGTYFVQVNGKNRISGNKSFIKH